MLGFPGSGKSTICAEVAEALEGTWLSASGALRAFVDQNPEVSAGWQSAWAMGLNAPDNEVLPVLWGSYVSSKKSPVLLDGYPRTVEQLLDFHARGGYLARVIHLCIGEDHALARLGLRSSDSGRTDDSPAIHAARVQREAAHIDALLARPEIAEIVVQINADCERAQVTANVVAAIT
jgi:adenylate kinase